MREKQPLVHCSTAVTVNSKYFPTINGGGMLQFPPSLRQWRYTVNVVYGSSFIDAVVETLISYGKLSKSTTLLSHRQLYPESFSIRAAVIYKDGTPILEADKAATRTWRRQRYLTFSVITTTTCVICRPTLGRTL